VSTPTVADLDAATAATETAIADPSATLADVYLAAEAEEAAYSEIFAGPCDTPYSGPEMELEL
jgi:hypothetical protein